MLDRAAVTGHRLEIRLVVFLSAGTIAAAAGALASAPRLVGLVSHLCPL